MALSAVLAVVALCGPTGADAAGTGAIEGEITGPGATPIAEVWACAYLVQSEEIAENCDFTGTDGLYSIQGLEAGAYKVEFWPESMVPSYVGEFYNDKPFWEEADEVEVQEGVVTTGVDAELAEAATIEGEVRAASLGGPVEDVLVCAQLPTGAPEGCTPTRPDGSYRLDGLPGGEYKVQFIPVSFRHNLLNQFYDHKRAFADADILTVATGETETGIDADLEAGAEIRGTVYSATSRVPIPKVAVCGFFFEDVAEEWWPRQCVYTSGTGSYALNALDTDSYKVAFSLEFREFFGEPVLENEDDGYLTQYFDNKPTLTAADPLALVVPEVRTGIDGHIQPSQPGSPGFAPAPVVPPALAGLVPRRKSAKRCRPGFRKKKVAGKRRCVKVHRPGKGHRTHRHGGRP